MKEDTQYGDLRGVSLRRRLKIGFSLGDLGEGRWKQFPSTFHAVRKGEIM